MAVTASTGNLTSSGVEDPSREFTEGLKEVPRAARKNSGGPEKGEKGREQDHVRKANRYSCSAICLLISSP